MQDLYTDFAQEQKGYTEDDFQSLCVHYGGVEVAQVFSQHIYGTEDYLNSLSQFLPRIGLSIKDLENPSLTAHLFGFITAKIGGKTIIKKIHSNSSADLAGLSVEDEIISVNGKQIEKNLNDFLSKDIVKVNLSVKSRFQTKEITLKSASFYPLKKVERSQEVSDSVLLLRKKWGGASI